MPIEDESSRARKKTPSFPLSDFSGSNFDEESYPILQSADDHSALARFSKKFAIFSDIFCDITVNAFSMAGSFSFSWEVYFAALFILLMSETDEESDSATLISVCMNTILLMLVIPWLSAIGFILSRKIGEYKKLKEEVDERTLDKTCNVSIQANDADSEDDAIQAARLDIEQTYATGIFTAFATGITATLPLYFSEPILINVFRQDPVVASDTQDFLRPYSLFMILLALRVAVEQFLFAIKKNQHAMFISLPSLLAGILAAIYLGFDIDLGFMETRNLGPLGIALGFGIETCVTCAAFFLYTLLNKDCREFDLYGALPEKLLAWCKAFLNSKESSDVAQLGKTLFVSTALESSLVLSAGILSGIISEEAQSAMSFCMEMVYLELIFILAFSMTCAQTLGRALGAKNYQHAANLMQYASMISLLCLLPFPLLFAFFPESFEFISGGTIDTTSDGKSVSDILNTLAPIMAIAEIFDAWGYNVLQQLRVAGHGRICSVPNLLSAVSILIGIGVSAGLGLGTGLGVIGVGIGYLTALCLRALLLTVIFDEEVIALINRAKETSNIPEIRRLSDDEAEEYEPIDLRRPDSEPNSPTSCLSGEELQLADSPPEHTQWSLWPLANSESDNESDCEDHEEARNLFQRSA